MRIADYHQGRDAIAGQRIAHERHCPLGGAAGGWVAYPNTILWSTPFVVFGLIGIGYSFLLICIFKKCSSAAQLANQSQSTEKLFFRWGRSAFQNSRFSVAASFLELAWFCRLGNEQMDADISERVVHFVADRVGHAFNRLHSRCCVFRCDISAGLGPIDLSQKPAGRIIVSVSWAFGRNG